MPKKPRVVLDTNILVSGTIATQGFPSRIFDAAVAQELVLVVSSYILAEYFDVLKRPHIAKKYPKSSDRAKLFTEYLQKRANKSIPSQLNASFLTTPKTMPSSRARRGQSTIHRFRR